MTLLGDIDTIFLIYFSFTANFARFWDKIAMKQPNQTKNGCICNSFAVQVEQNEGDFYDPEDKCLRRTDGKKFRYNWVGCPKHNGRRNYRIPTIEEGVREADKQG